MVIAITAFSFTIILIPIVIRSSSRDILLVELFDSVIFNVLAISKAAWMKLLRYAGVSITIPLAM
jgi:hypothetical protein